jgi:hypothetical protein
MNGLLQHVRDIAESLVAMALAFAPQRYWSSLPDYPIHRMAVFSGFVTIFAAIALGTRGFFIYIYRVAQATDGLIVKIAEKQLTGELLCDPMYNIAPLGVNMLSPIAFLAATPMGLLSSYLMITGISRTFTAGFGDPSGDPLLTFIDSLVRRSVSDTRAGQERRAREARDGPETPDRLFTGAWAGLDDVDFVVVSSRRKPEWDKGTFVITEDTWFMLGAPFDMETPHGLRTVYPLTEHKALDVLRRGVPYVLPALSKTPRRQGKDSGAPAPS